MMSKIKNKDTVHSQPLIIDIPVVLFILCRAFSTLFSNSMHQQLSARDESTGWI